MEKIYDICTNRYYGTRAAKVQAGKAASGSQIIAKAPDAVVAGAYIVMFKAGAQNPGQTAKALGAAHGFKVGHVYAHALKGFSAHLSARAVAALQKNPNVLSIEPDRIMKAFAQTLPTGVSRIDAAAADGVSAVLVDGFTVTP